MHAFGAKPANTQRSNPGEHCFVANIWCLIVSTVNKYADITPMLILEGKAINLTRERP
jgi:hypothetical protein